MEMEEHERDSEWLKVVRALTYKAEEAIGKEALVNDPVGTILLTALSALEARTVPHTIGLLGI
jgi:hypothetical protein